MNTFRPYLVIIVVLLDVFVLHSQASTDAEKEHQEDLNKLCSKTAYVRNYLDIHINNLKGSRACNVTLEPNERKNTLNAYFKKYVAEDTCTGAINFYDAKDKAQIGDKGFCEKEATKAHYELGSKGILTIAQGDSSMDAVVRVVEYFIKQNDCPSEKFDCGTMNLCIAKSLTCDKNPDCANSMDEGDDCKERDLSTLYNVLFIVGIVASFLVCAVMVWEETSRKKRAHIPLEVKKTLEPGQFDGAYAQNFGQPKPTVFFPSSFNAPQTQAPAPEPPKSPVFA